MKRLKKFLSTIIMKRYLISLIFRLLIFGSVLALYITHKEWLSDMAMQPIVKGITPIHILWVVFMVIMLMHIFPLDKLMTMALRKAEKEVFVPVPDYDREGLLEFVKDQNVKAWCVMLVWLLFNCIFGILSLMDIIGPSELIMLTVFFFLCDYICILFFCPFQTLIMKNKCCVNCRIYDWGHFMMFTPMLFIKDFFSWSLFVMSFIVLIRWEIIYAKYPERFWSGSNQVLKCANCKDKICGVKGKLIKIEKD